MRKQLVRVVTHRARLNELYGEGYFDALLNSLASWQSAAAASGVVVEDVLLIDDLPAHDLPGALKKRLAQLNRTPADAVLLLGSGEVVPFYPIRSVDFLVAADGDACVSSDDPYVAFDRHNVLYKPDCPIGRLPDGGPGQPELLLELLGRAATYHASPLRPALAALGLTAQSWLRESRAAFTLSNEALYACPPCGLPGHRCIKQPLAPEWLQTHTFHYYNVHGTRSNTRWYGQCEADGCEQRCAETFVPLLEAEAVPPLSNTWVFNEASYSAQLGQDSLGWRFLKQGALCYIGATATTYASLGGPGLEGADYIAHAFMQGLRLNQQGRTRLSVGEMFKRAKLDYRGRSNFERKTAAAFVLLGDPSLVPFYTESVGQHANSH